MELILRKGDVEKILSTMDIEQIDQALEANYAHWEVHCESSTPFMLTKKEEG